ncbi:MAG: hypothetical protein ABIH26_05730 [Candidatus Eisenbacteria bacterium]
MRLPKSAWILLFFGAFLFAGCGDDEKTSTVGPPDGKDQVVLTLENFGETAPYHMALWSIDGSDTSLVLRFGVQDGAPVTLAGAPIPSIDQEDPLGNADRLLVTLESDTLGSLPGPSRLLGGPIAAGAATLTTADAGGVGADLAVSAGFFLFDTPTTARQEDCGRGVWWTDGEGAAALALPVLSGGWVYEGWVIDRVSGLPYSTGRFTGPTGADRDGAGATAGPGGGYGFPGQDFVTAAGSVPVLEVDDGSFAVAVTLEPEPDLADGPFFLKLLEKNAGSGGLLLTATNLPRLPAGSYYEIWASFPDTLMSVGKFRYVNRRIVDVESGEEIPGFPSGCSLADASAIRISVENGSAGPEPSGSFLLAGSIAGGAATLSPADPLALGHAYNETAVRYVLETPSTASPGDYRRGIWFFEVAGGETTSTLPIPDAPSGWKYEGWVYKVFGAPDTASTGSFVTPLGADADSAGPSAGSDGVVPPFPGQDFVSFPIRNLDDGTYGVFLSLEPEDDPAPRSPFLRIFEDNDIDAVGQNVTQPLGSLSATLPTGTVQVKASKTIVMNSRGGSLPRALITFGRK